MEQEKKDMPKDNKEVPKEQPSRKRGRELFEENPEVSKPKKQLTSTNQ